MAFIVTKGYLAVYLLLVVIAIAYAVTMPFRNTESTTPPVVFGRTPYYWQRGAIKGAGSSGRSFHQDNTNVMSNVMMFCREDLPIIVQTCEVFGYQCANRCGQILNDVSGPVTARVSCSCDPMCMVYNDCCDDFADQCPLEYAEFQAKYSPFQGVSSECTDDGYKIITSCFPENLDDSIENNIRNEGEIGAASNPGFAHLNPLNNLLDMSNFPAMGGNSTHNASAPDSHGNGGSNKTTHTKRFTDSLIVTDPSSGLTYSNQSVMACSRNRSRHMLAAHAQEKASGSGSSSSPSASTEEPSEDFVAPILWNRRLFLVDSVAEPQQAVLIDDELKSNWIDSPPPSVTPRHCAKRFQLSCWRAIQRESCWFIDPPNMRAFCKAARQNYATQLEINAQIKRGNLTGSILGDDWMTSNSSLTEPVGEGGNVTSNKAKPTTVRPTEDPPIPYVEFLDTSTNLSCQVRNFKNDFRTIKGVSFSLTMALNHETGVFVVSNNDPMDVNWEKIQCTISKNQAEAMVDPICDRVYCSPGYFYAPGREVTSSCLKPDLLEISFMFRGIDSATLTHVLDLIQASSVHYGSGMFVTAMGGFVDMKLGNMAYTDSYSIVNISITDTSERIPSTLALVQSLQELELRERLRFPASIQLCFVFSEITTGSTAEQNGNVLITEKETVRTRCDLIYLHERSVYSVSLHKPGRLEGGPAGGDVGDVLRLAENRAVSLGAGGCVGLAAMLGLVVVLEMVTALGAA